MIKAFVFDIGNVLVNVDFPTLLGKLLAHSGNSSITDRAAVEAAIGAIKTDYENGKIQQQTFVSRATKAIDFTASDDEFKRLWQEVFSPNPPAVGLVDALAPHYPLYLLSNTNDLHLDYLIREYRLFDRFAGGVYSHLAGCMKPDPDIYRQALTKFGLVPGETVFIDDLAANIAIARQLGFHAFQYSSTQHDALLEWLDELGTTFSRPVADPKRNC